jgi:hypothetical protein
LPLSSASAPISVHLCPTLSPTNHEQQEAIRTLGAKGRGLEKEQQEAIAWVMEAAPTSG